MQSQRAGYPGRAGPQRHGHGFGLLVGKDVGAGGGNIDHHRRHYYQGFVEFAQRGVGVLVLDGDIVIKLSPSNAQANLNFGNWQIFRLSNYLLST